MEQQAPVCLGYLTASPAGQLSTEMMTALCPPDEGEQMAPVQGQVRSFCKEGYRLPRGYVNYVYVTYRLCYCRVAVGCWKEDMTAMPSAAIRCFSDDTWWTKDYCAELHPSRYLHCCTYCWCPRYPDVLLQHLRTTEYAHIISVSATAISFFFFLFFHICIFSYSI